MQACAHLENSTGGGGGGPDKIFSHKRVSQRAVRFLGPIAARRGSVLSLEFLGNLLPPVIFQGVAIHTPFPHSPSSFVSGLSYFIFKNHVF